MGGPGSGPKVGDRLTAPQSLEVGFSFNKYLASNLRPYKMATLNQDFDCAVIIDGPEGAGKSVLAQQVAAFLDKDHHLDLDTQICFTPDDFMAAVQTLEKGKAIVWDEARRGVNRRRSMDTVNLDVTDMLAECRQNNLFMVIVMPTFYDMDMNVAVWRTRFLIHVTFDFESGDPEKPLRRGFFRLYSFTGKKNLYTNRHLRQRYEYPLLSQDSFDASFPHHYCVDEQAYRAKKRGAESYYKSQKKYSNKALLIGLLDHLKEKGLLSGAWLQTSAAFLGVTDRTLQRWRQEDEARKNSSKPPEREEES